VKIGLHANGVFMIQVHVALIRSLQVHDDRPTDALVGRGYLGRFIMDQSGAETANVIFFVIVRSEGDREGCAK
jgi:hypothetical protein